MSIVERLEKGLKDHLMYRERVAAQIAQSKLEQEINEDNLQQIDTLVAMIRATLASSDAIAAVAEAKEGGLDAAAPPVPLIAPEQFELES